MDPNRQTVEEAINECREIGVDGFLEKYSGGQPRTHYLRHAGDLFPLKAIWAAAHRPTSDR